MTDLVNLTFDGFVAVIELNRPEKLNAMSLPMEELLLHHLESLAANNDARVIVLRGAGGSFCAGHDMADLEARPDEGPPPLASHLRRGQLALSEWYTILRAQPQPIIAAVQGHCVNYGLELAMNCDMVIAATDAKFLSRPLGGMRTFTHLWPWLVGIRKARELVFSRRAVSGEEAASLGMVNTVVAPEELEATAMTLAREIARTPLEFLSLEKQALNRCWDALGVPVGLASSADLASVAHTLPIAGTVRSIMRERGWRAALDFLAQSGAATPQG